MYGTEEFLWSGLRGRLERTGRVRPRTGASPAGMRQLERIQRQARPNTAGRALRARVQTVGSAQQH
jgi:hypothetical protein